MEVIKPIDFEIAERFFSRDEYLALLNQPREIKQKFFYMIWTLKESYIKAEGKGLHIPLNSFKIIFDDSRISVITEDKKTNYSFYQSFLNDTTIYSVCFLEGNSHNVKNLSIEDILCDVG